MWGCLCELVSVWWVKDRLYSGLGILIGMLLAMAGIWHMWKVLDTALELGNDAQKYATSKNLLRYAVVLVVFAVLMLTHFADPLAAFAGLMGMKASAYLQPLYADTKKRRGGETMTNGILLNGSADIDFMIHGVFPISFRTDCVDYHNPYLSPDRTLLILAFAIAANRAMKHASEVPGFFQNIVELVVEKLDGMVKMVMGKNAAKFANYIGTIFIFILISNFSGLLGLRPPTADYGVTLPLGLATFTLIHYNKLKHKKLKGALAELCDPWPIWAPINIIGYIAVPVSLSLRLFANVLSGVVMMALVYGLLRVIAIGWPAVLHVYFDLFSGAIQTYVFCMLTMTYLSDAIGEEG